MHRAGALSSLQYPMPFVVRQALGSIGETLGPTQERISMRQATCRLDCLPESSLLSMGEADRDIIIAYTAERTPLLPLWSDLRCPREERQSRSSTIDSISELQLVQTRGTASSRYLSAGAGKTVRFACSPPTYSKPDADIYQSIIVALFPNHGLKLLREGQLGLQQGTQSKH